MSWHKATLQDLANLYLTDFQKLTTVDCSANCGPVLPRVFNDGRQLADLMKESGAPEGACAEPIRLCTDLETGFFTAVDLRGEDRIAPMLGPARALNNWLVVHPVPTLPEGLGPKS